MKSKCFLQGTIQCGCGKIKHCKKYPNLTFNLVIKHKILQMLKFYYFYFKEQMLLVNNEQLYPASNSFCVLDMLAFSFQNFLV